MCLKEGLNYGKLKFMIFGTSKISQEGTKV